MLKKFNDYNTGIQNIGEIINIFDDIEEDYENKKS